MRGSGSSKLRRRTAAAFLGLPVFGVVIAALLVAGAPAQATGDDDTPPVFEGLQSAVTCLGGPVEVGRQTRYHLSWNAATDDVTPSSKIVY